MIAVVRKYVPTPAIYQREAVNCLSSKGKTRGLFLTLSWLTHTLPNWAGFVAVGVSFFKLHPAEVCACTLVPESLAGVGFRLEDPALAPHF